MSSSASQCIIEGSVPCGMRPSSKKPRATPSASRRMAAITVCTSLRRISTGTRTTIPKSTSTKPPLPLEVVHDLRDDHLPVPGEVRPDLRRVLGFEPEVHLLGDAGLELVERRAHALDARMHPPAAHPAHDAPRGAQVGCDGPLDVRPGPLPGPDPPG